MYSAIGIHQIDILLTWLESRFATIRFRQRVSLSNRPILSRQHTHRCNDGDDDNDNNNNDDDDDDDDDLLIQMTALFVSECMSV